MTVKSYGNQDLAKHTTADSCWVIYQNKVYDVTEFIQDHPGGDDLILDYGGKDVTAVMKDVLEHEHSDAAYEILEEYCIGVYDPTATPASLHEQRMKLLQEEEEYKTYVKEDFRPSETDVATDMKKNQFLDLRKALIPQMIKARFTKEFYLEQVHKPRYIATPAIFFGHPLLEPLSKTAWYVIPTLWLPYMSWHLYKSLAFNDPLTTGISYLGGILIWSLLEYVLHRFLFHVDDYLPDHQIAFVLHFTLHGFHHYLPMDR
jgi:4-hydroxysphinganine ceramide fatty acyl 2-hydroxylase